MAKQLKAAIPARRAAHPGGLGVDDQLELGPLHDRQGCGDASQNVTPNFNVA
jgi:hypothetical protein